MPALQKERHTSASCSCTVIPPALSVSSMPPSAAFAERRNKHECFILLHTTNYEMGSSIHFRKRYEYELLLNVDLLFKTLIGFIISLLWHRYRKHISTVKEWCLYHDYISVQYKVTLLFYKCYLSTLAYCRVQISMKTCVKDSWMNTTRGEATMFTANGVLALWQLRRKYLMVFVRSR